MDSRWALLSSKSILGLILFSGEGAAFGLTVSAECEAVAEKTHTKAKMIGFNRELCMVISLRWNQAARAEAGWVPAQVD